MKLEQAWRLSSSGCSFLCNVLAEKEAKKKCSATQPCVFLPLLLFYFKDVTLITIYDLIQGPNVTLLVTINPSTPIPDPVHTI